MVVNTVMMSDAGAILETAVRICRGYLNGPWKKITPNDITLNRISGGLSNWLYAVRLRGEGKEEERGNTGGGGGIGQRYPTQVLLRLYGQASHQGEAALALESIITESVIFTLLSERNLGPKLYGIFPGGRIEEYIPARPLKHNEMSSPRLSLLVADKMAAIHTMNVPITKEPSWIWETINRWLSSIKQFCYESNKEEMGESEKEGDGGDKAADRVLKPEHYDALDQEVTWLRSHLSSIWSPVVFCHNDLQGGNILLREEDSAGAAACEPSSSIVIIDFEYCSYNYRGFDLANHFVEWAYDYSTPQYPNFTVGPNHVPSPYTQRVFLERYLEEVRRNGGRYGDTDVKCLLNEVRHFTLASHLFWSLWSFVNAKVSQIPFGYYEYAQQRLKCYYELKGELTAGSK